MKYCWSRIMCVLKGKNWTFSLQNLLVYPNPSNPHHLKLKHLTNPSSQSLSSISRCILCHCVRRGGQLQPAGEQTTLPLTKSNITISILLPREGGREVENISVIIFHVLYLWDFICLASFSCSGRQTFLQLKFASEPDLKKNPLYFWCLL